MSTKPKIWEVWWARVAFEDQPKQWKRRPVLIINNQTCIILSLKITSHPPREEFWGEYALQKWQYAGLSKPATVRISKLLKLKPMDFISQMGDLHMIDRLMVEEYINKYYLKR